MENLNRIHLSGLRAVEAVGRLGSLKKAAGELGVTVGAVSQQVQKTEHQLGCALFERLAKGLVPTPLGGEVLRRLTAGMAELSAAVAIGTRRDDDTLTVSVAPVFAGKWLVWKLPKFYERHPGVRVRVDATVDLVDPETSDIDLCIRVGPGRWPNVNAEKLVDHRVFPVCSPALARRVKQIADLADVPIIRDRGHMFSWNAWLGPQGFDESILGDGPVFSDGSLCLDAAIAGQGVFLAWETLAFYALDAGQVAAPLPGCYPTGLAYWLVTGRHGGKPAKVRAFERWLRDEMAASLQPDPHRSTVSIPAEQKSTS